MMPFHFQILNIQKKQKKIKLVELNKNISKYKLLLDELLQDYKSDFINQEDYNCFKEKYLYEINKFNLEKEQLTKKRINEYNLNWLNEFSEKEKIKVIDKNVIDKFVENIYIDDNKNVEIVFKFKEQYKIALEYLQNKNNML